MTTTQRYEIEAWLGEDHRLTDDQVTELARIADQIARRYPDDADDREIALTVAYRLMVEDPETVVAELGAALRRARLAEARATTALKQAAAQIIIGERHGGRGISTDAGFARAAGVERKTARDWKKTES